MEGLEYWQNIFKNFFCIKQIKIQTKSNLLQKSVMIQFQVECDVYNYVLEEY